MMSASKLLLLIGSILVVLVESSTASCPRIYPRSSWNAKKPDQAIKNLSLSPVSHVVIHHTAGASLGRSCFTVSGCKWDIQRIQNDHLKLKYGDIGYSFLIGGDGNIYEGRGWNKHGAHEPRFNSRSIGIAFMGNFNYAYPTTTMIAQAKSLIKCGVNLNKIARVYKLIGHRQAKNPGSTDCPGHKLYSVIKGWTNWTPYAR